MNNKNSTLNFIKRGHSSLVEIDLCLDYAQRYLKIKGLGVTGEKSGGPTHEIFSTYMDDIISGILLASDPTERFCGHSKSQFEYINVLHNIRTARSHVTEEFENFISTFDSDGRDMVRQMNTLMYILFTCSLEIVEFTLQTYSKIIEDFKNMKSDYIEGTELCIYYSKMIRTITYSFSDFNNYDKSKETPRTILSKVHDSSLFSKRNFDVIKSMVTTSVCIPYHTRSLYSALVIHPDENQILVKLHELIDSLNTLLERITPIY
ncbi:MAG: hypothetical protein ACRC0G_07255 [Fusobacteriaceae bacterium]